MTAEQVRSGDKGKQKKSGPRRLDEDEKAALAALMEG